MMTCYIHQYLKNVGDIMSVTNQKSIIAKKKRISVQSAKAKGRRLQKYVAEKLSEITGIPHGKDCLIQSREMGQSGTDVKLIGDALDKIPLSIECKYCEAWSVNSWIEQAKANQLPDTDWVLCAKRNHNDPVVIIDAKVFFKILKGK
jgi:hypothetical protein